MIAGLDLLNVVVETGGTVQEVQLNAIAEPVSYGTNFGYPPEAAVGLSRQGELEHSALQTNAADPAAVSHIRLDTSGGPC